MSLLKFDKQNFGYESFGEFFFNLAQQTNGENVKNEALKLTFSLPSSSYATSLLREIVFEEDGSLEGVDM